MISCMRAEPGASTASLFNVSSASSACPRNAITPRFETRALLGVCDKRLGDPWLGRLLAARDSYEKALALVRSEPERRFLAGRLRELQ